MRHVQRAFVGMAAAGMLLGNACGDLDFSNKSGSENFCDGLGALSCGFCRAHFRCSDARYDVVDAMQACDGKDDCADGADELGCDDVMFHCADGTRIPKYRQCDVVYGDCPNDTSDEDACFGCDSNVKIIPDSRRCDGVADCDDCADELECP